MLLRDYITQAMRTYDTSRTKQDGFNNAILGLYGEAGELTDHIKKILYQDHPIDTDQIKKELGDIYWYLALLSYLYEVEFTTYEGVALFDTAELRERLYTSRATTFDLISKIRSIFNHISSLADHRHTILGIDSIFEDLVLIGAHFNLSLENILEANIQKLKIRYPEGFSSVKSRERSE